MGAAMIIPAIISAVSTGLGMYNQYSTQSKQDSEAAAGIRQNEALQQQANADVAQEIQKQSQSNPQPYQQQQQQNYLDQLKANQAMATSQLFQPNMGDAYRARAAQNQGVQTGIANTNAGLMASMDAPQMQRQAEQQDFAKLGDQIGEIGSDAYGDNYLTQLKIQNTRPNPWLSALASAGQAYGGMGMNSAAMANLFGNAGSAGAGAGSGMAGMQGAVSNVITNMLGG